MQDPNPLPWGAQDRFQAHFIVRKHIDDPVELTARTILKTSGHFGSKKVTGRTIFFGRLVINERQRTLCGGGGDPWRSDDTL